MHLSNKILPILILIICFNAYASELMQPMDYHASQAKVDTEGKWLALQTINNVWYLVDAEPKFKRVDDEIEGPKQGINVSVEIPGVSFLLMDESLSVGTVQSSWENQDEKNFASWFEKSRLPDVGKSRQINFNKQVYELRNIAGDIFIVSGEKSQKLFSYSEEYESNASIQWLGDLDRDGKLDLIVDASGHYNVSEPRLYLSGKAESGSLVKLVASRRTTGC